MAEIMGDFFVVLHVNGSFVVASSMARMTASLENFQRSVAKHAAAEFALWCDEMDIPKADRRKSFQRLRPKLFHINSRTGALCLVNPLLYRQVRAAGGRSRRQFAYLDMSVPVESVLSQLEERLLAVYEKSFKLKMG